MNGLDGGELHPLAHCEDRGRTCWKQSPAHAFQLTLSIVGPSNILNPDDKPCVTPNKSHLSTLSFTPSSHCGGAPMPTVGGTRREGSYSYLQRSKLCGSDDMKEDECSTSAQAGGLCVWTPLQCLFWPWG